MNALKNLGLALAVCLLASGCAMEKEPEVAVTPDLVSTYPEIAREMSDGRVQMYSLDDPAAPPVASLALSPPEVQDGGMAYSADPNVTVYPMFEETTRPQDQRPALVPPSDQYRPMESPFGGPLQTAVPVGDVLMTPPAPEAPEPYVNGAASSIYFKHGSSTLNETGKQVLDYTARNAAGKLTVAGFASEKAETADPVERSIVNLKVSMDRAFQVSSGLIRSGVPATMIETRAYGDTRPALVSAEGDIDTASRRVEIHAEGDGSLSAPIPPLSRY